MVEENSRFCDVGSNNYGKQIKPRRRNATLASKPTADEGISTDNDDDDGINSDIGSNNNYDKKIKYSALQTMDVEEEEENGDNKEDDTLLTDSDNIG